MSTTIEVSKIEPPGYNKKQGTITDASGATWKAWPETFVGLEIGRRYSIEFTTSNFKGKDYRTITKAYPADDVAPGNGNGVGSAPRNHPPHEQQFVTTLLAAFIRAGAIKPGDKQTLWQTVKDLRGCYAATFGQNGQERTH